jgi:hypothetical protein
LPKLRAHLGTTMAYTKTTKTYHESGQYRTRLPAEAAYLLSQRGHDAVSSSFRTSFILAPQDGHNKLVGRFIFSTTSGFVRAWLKLWRGCGGSILTFAIWAPRADDQ